MMIEGYKGRKITLLNKPPLTLFDEDLKYLPARDIIKVKSLCISGKFYNLNIQSLECECPEFIEKNKDNNLNSFKLRNSCLHIYEWIAYASDSALRLSIFYENIIHRKESVSTERTYEQVSKIIVPDGKIIITYPIDSFRERPKHSYIKIPVKFNDDDYNNIGWCEIYFNDKRFAYNWISGSCTYGTNDFKYRAIVEKEIVSMYYPSLDSASVTQSGITISKNGIVGTIIILDLEITLEIKNRGKFIYLSSNFFNKSRISIKTKSLDDSGNYQFDSRYSFLSKEIAIFYNKLHRINSLHKSRQRRKKNTNRKL